MITLETITGYYHEKLAKTGSFDQAFKKSMWKAYLAGREERDEPLPFDCVVWNDSELRDAEAGNDGTSFAELHLGKLWPAEDGWQEWAPGMQRPTPDTHVRVRLRNGNIYTGVVGNIRWTHTPPGMDEHDLDVVAYKVLEAAPVVDEDGWIQWRGGECPVIPGCKVELRFRNGKSEQVAANMRRWWHSIDDEKRRPFDIVAYRVVT